MAWLHPPNTLGSYPDREEFQVERVIVWVEVSSHGSRAAWLEQADRMFEGVWRAIPAVVAAAQQASRSAIPEFWKAFDETGAAGAVLAVRGIWIDPVSGSADYEVAPNPDFPLGASGTVPEMPEGHSIVVSRQSDGNLRSR